MDIRHLRYFTAAVEEGSLQGAAQRMHVAQPALSRRIRDLEADLGCELLTRGVRGVTATPAGAAFYRDALALLAGLDEAAQRARRIGREHEEGVRLGLVHTSRKYAFLQEATAAWRAGEPTGGLAFVRGLSPELAHALVEGRLDMTLLFERRIGAEAFDERLIHRERYVLAAHPSHRLAQPGAADLAVLSGEPLVWLSRSDNGDSHDALLQQCRLHGLEPAIAQLTHSHEEQIELTTVSGGACLTPASTLLSTPAGALVFRPLPKFEMELSLSLAWRRDLGGSLAGRLLAELHQAIDRHQDAIRGGRSPWARLDGCAVVRVP
ncbi:LysR family transcriptional regulator [Phenylobacterium sp. LjRoot219]|uniref:LysR family transcriptional regulator n=1 Tax=Phenylobacterium sp. LjRoot219 TaxID=3342283 RepID=UPI003ECEC847